MMNNFSRKLIDARMTEISPYLQTGDRIVDIGSGNCFLAERLISLGYSVTSVDIKNKSKVKNIIPIIYDGKNLPLGDDSFDVALLITVLHHVKEPVQVLEEAKRVAKRIIIMEDLYRNSFQKYITFIMDSVINLEFYGHPHSNKTDKEWLNTFEKLNLNTRDKKQNNFWKLFTNGTYYLARND